MSDAVFTVTPKSRSHVIDAVRCVPEGFVVRLTPPRRTTAQNARLWAMLHTVARSIAWHGEWLEPEDWKDLFTGAWRKQRALPGIDGGIVFLGARTSQMSKDEISDLMELMTAFAAERGVDLGGPDA